MKIHLLVRKIANLSNSEISSLWELTMKCPNSLMRGQLDKHKKSKAIAIIAYSRNKMIGWGCISCSEVYLYVNPKFRKKGVGKQILFKAIKVFSYKRYNLNYKNFKVYRTHNHKFYEKTLKVDGWQELYETSKISLTKANNIVRV